jgi:hypothetical protein
VAAATWDRVGVPPHGCERGWERSYTLEATRWLADDIEALLNWYHVTFHLLQLAHNPDQGTALTPGRVHGHTANHGLDPGIVSTVEL